MSQWSETVLLVSIQMGEIKTGKGDKQPAKNQLIIRLKTVAKAAEILLSSLNDDPVTFSLVGHVFLGEQTDAKPEFERGVGI